MSRNVSGTRHRVASLHSRPAANSPPAVFINGWTRVTGDEYETLHIGLDLEFADRPGEFVPWIPEIGDYSTHIDGRVRLDGDWIQLIDPLFRVPAWMPKEAPEPIAELYAYVDSIAGNILHLQPLEATNANGVREVIEAGDFLITRVTGDRVEFRAEVESDMACGEDIPPPPILPPVLRAHPSAFFNVDDTPRFATKYTKGC